MADVEAAEKVPKGSLLCCEPWGPCWNTVENAQLDPSTKKMRLVCAECTLEARPYRPLREEDSS